MSWIDDEIEYCRAREKQERGAAGAAIDPASRDSHFTMAERYADRADNLSVQADESFRKMRMANPMPLTQ